MWFDYWIFHAITFLSPSFLFSFHPACISISTWMCLRGGDSVTVPGQKPVSVFFTDDVLQWHTDR